jgi:hypothetical protein
MPGLRKDRTRLRVRRAQDLHARVAAPREGEGVACCTTQGHPSRLSAGGGSTAFSGDRAQRARRKAVDAPEAPDPGSAGARAPDAKHLHPFAARQSLAMVCARASAELGGRRRTPLLASLCAGGGSTAFSGDRAQARRKAVDAPEASDPRSGGAAAPLPKHRPCLAPWQSLAVLCARGVAQLGCPGPLPTLAAGAALRREFAAGVLPPLRGELSDATAGSPYAAHGRTRAGP